jgi:ABC-2 type transport system ATP-binding protein
MKVSDILRVKGNTLFTVSSKDALSVAVGVMADNDIGSLVVMDQGRIVVLDTPAALKASVGKDRVQIGTRNDANAIALLKERFGLDAEVRDGHVQFSVADGEEFVPNLFNNIDLGIRSVSVARPSLDDVFMAYTGRTIRDAEQSATDKLRSSPLMAAGRRR